MNQRIGLLIVYLASDAPDIDIDDVGRRIEMNYGYGSRRRGFSTMKHPSMGTSIVRPTSRTWAG